jgi:hypothetical protein
MLRLVSSVLAFALAATTHLSAAHAERPAVAETVTTTPNRSLLHSGVVTLGLAYVPAFIVGAESSLEADKALFIPVAGPWIDYVNRDCSTCANETANKVLLVTDGIFQGIGALNILGAFVFPETRVVSARAKPAQVARLRLSPARLGSGSYGVLASGAF